MYIMMHNYIAGTDIIIIITISNRRSKRVNENIIRCFQFGNVFMPICMIVDASVFEFREFNIIIIGRRRNCRTWQLREN